MLIPVDQLVGQLPPRGAARGTAWRRVQSAPLMKGLVKKLSDADDPGSFSNRMRGRRFALFERLVAPLGRPLKILDIGGTNAFWEMRRWAGLDDVSVTLVNLHPEPQRHANIFPTAGDATNLPQYADGSFDVAFSNSVIEHLFTFENQLKMAREVRRVGRHYWVQTPNYWFPMEPHFQVPGWQWMPRWLRVQILRRCACGRRGPIPDPTAARRSIEEVHLLTRRQMRRLFPDAQLYPERFAGLVKSWIAWG